MDRLEHKLGREGLRARVRTVASSQAKARGKENFARSPRLSQVSQEAAVAAKKRVSRSPLPLRSNVQESEAEIIPPAAGKQIPRTPVTTQQPQQFIPKGKLYLLCT